MEKQINGNAVQVIYCKHSDPRMAKGDITFELCMSVNKIVPKQALCAQKLRNVWAICVSDAEAKKTLLHRGIMFNHNRVDLYAVNPNDTDTSQCSERVVIKDLPFWENDTLILDYLKSVPQITSCSSVYQSRARNNITNSASSFLNGDRFVFVNNDIYPPLPKSVQIGGYSCRIRHSSQIQNCVRCRSSSHRTDDHAACPLYLEAREDVIAFSGGVFSNFNKCKMTLDGMEFATSEHAYQWRACTEALRDDLAEMVYKAATPREAKLIAKEIKHETTNWHTIKYDVMKEVLRAKLSSSQQFKDALLDTGDKILVEARIDDYWGSGLSHALTVNTNPDMYPGSNKLGLLLAELRGELRNATVDITEDVIVEEQSFPPTTPTTPTTPLKATPTVRRSSRSSVRVGSQSRASSLPPGILKEVKSKDTPLLKDCLLIQSKRKHTLSSTQSESSNSSVIDKSSCNTARDQTSALANLTGSADASTTSDI